MISSVISSSFSSSSSSQRAFARSPSSGGDWRLQVASGREGQRRQNKRNKRGHHEARWAPHLGCEPTMRPPPVALFESAPSEPTSSPLQKAAHALSRSQRFSSTSARIGRSKQSKAEFGRTCATRQGESMGDERRHLFNTHVKRDFAPAWVASKRWCTRPTCACTQRVHTCTNNGSPAARRTHRHRVLPLGEASESTTPPYHRCGTPRCPLTRNRSQQPAPSLRNMRGKLS